MAERYPAVLVTGGTGALGAAVLDELLQSGYPVTATWLVEAERERAERDLGHHERLTLVEADVMDEQAAADAVAGVDELGAVVNLVGGFSAPGKVHESSVEDFETHAAAQPAAGVPARARRDAAPRGGGRRLVRVRLGAAGAAAVPGRRRLRHREGRACSPSSRPSTSSTAAMACAPTRSSRA